MMIITLHSPSQLKDSSEAWTTELEQLNLDTLNGIRAQLMHPTPKLPADLCLKQLMNQLKQGEKQQSASSPNGSRSPVRWYRKYWTRGQGGGHRDRLLCRLSLFMLEQQRTKQPAKLIITRRIYCVRQFLNEYTVFRQQSNQ